MRNIVRFNEQRLSNSIKSGGFNIGVDNKSANLTGFFNGITPIIGGYVIYVNKVSGGPSIYTPQNDTGLINITKSLGGNVSTATEALVWINSQSNMTVINGNYPPIVTDGLVLNLDAGLVSSYPKTGTTWRDLSGNGNTGTLVNGPTFSSDGGGNIVFDGIDDFISLNQVGNTTSFTYEVFLKCDNINKDQMYIGYSNIGAHYIRIVGAKAFLSVSAGGQRTLTHSQTLIQGEYYHIVSIYNGVQLKIYVNNNLTVGPVINQTLAGWGTTRIGRWLDGDQRSFVGNINTLRIYNRELSANEVLQNYYAGLQRFIPTNGLVLSLDAQNTNLYATSTTTANDISGSNNNGSMLNGVQYVGSGGGSWRFDGVNDTISVADNNSLKLASDKTLYLWVNMGANSSGCGIAGKSNSSVGGMALGYGWGGNGFMALAWNSSNNPFLVKDLTRDINKWVFLAAVQSGSTRFIYALDSQGLRSSSFSGGNHTWNNNIPLTIGNANNNTNFAPSNTQINNVNVFNRALTQTEITTIFNATRTRYGV